MARATAPAPSPPPSRPHARGLPLSKLGQRHERRGAAPRAAERGLPEHLRECRRVHVSRHREKLRDRRRGSAQRGVDAPARHTQRAQPLAERRVLARLRRRLRRALRFDDRRQVLRRAAVGRAWRRIRGMNISIARAAAFGTSVTRTAHARARARESAHRQRRAHTCSRDSGVRATLRDAEDARETDRTEPPVSGPSRPSDPDGGVGSPCGGGCRAASYPPPPPPARGDGAGAPGRARRRTAAAADTDVAVADGGATGVPRSPLRGLGSGGRSRAGGERRAWCPLPPPSPPRLAGVRARCGGGRPARATSDAARRARPVMSSKSPAQSPGAYAPMRSPRAPSSPPPPPGAPAPSPPPRSWYASAAPRSST